MRQLHNVARPNNDVFHQKMGCMEFLLGMLDFIYVLIRIM